MAFPRSKRGRFSVDGMPYIACVSSNGRTDDGGVRLRVIIAAEYGFKSLCIVSGMVNRDYWYDFPNIDRNKTYSITPRVVCEIIRYALGNGWSPSGSKTQTRLNLDNDGLSAIIKSQEIRE